MADARAGSSDQFGGEQGPAHDDDDLGPEDELIGKELLGKLYVKRLIAGGGMGAIYEVEHTLTGHRRALKVLRSKYVSVPASKERLMREAKVAGTLDTPYVAETYDAGYLDDGSAYVLMELLDGRQLLDLFQEAGRLAVSHACGLTVQLLEGLAIAHEAGIIHRDLKPENVYLVRGDDNTERVKILDFGIAKFTHSWSDAPSRLTADGTILGTPYYMSPEQAAGDAVDERTDIYSTGVMMYEGISGMLPFDGAGVGAVFAKIQLGEYVPLSSLVPDINPTLEAVLTKAMHLEANQRYPSAEAFRAALLPFAPSGTVSRGRTIPEGARRATLDYTKNKQRPVAETMPALETPAGPRPPAAPAPTLLEQPSRPTAKTPASVSPRARVEGRHSRLFASESSQRRFVSILLVGGLLAGLAVGVGVVVLPSDEASSSEETAEQAAVDMEPAEPEVAPAAEAAESAMAEAVQDAGVVAAEVEDPTTTMSTMRVGRATMRGGFMRAMGGGLTPAQAAGLDTNPYGS